MCIRDSSYAVIETNGTLSAALRPEKEPARLADLQLKVTHINATIPFVLDGQVPVSYTHLLSAVLLIGWCLIFLRCETTEKSMVRALYLAQKEQSITVGLLYQAPEAAADASEASGAVQLQLAQADTCLLYTSRCV